MTKEIIDPFEMAQKNCEKKRARNQEVRENNKITSRKVLPLIGMTDDIRRTYRAGQVWAAGIVGLLGGLLIALVARC
jgi:hypothetical protein